MGKQINYYLDVESFQKIAQAALEAGCLIVSGEFEPEPPKPSGDLTVIREELCYYYFYLPELGELNYKQSRAGRWCVDHLGEGATASSKGPFPGNGRTDRTDATFQGSTVCPHGLLRRGGAMDTPAGVADQGIRQAGPTGPKVGSRHPAGVRRCGVRRGWYIVAGPTTVRGVHLPHLSGMESAGIRAVRGRYCGPQTV